MNTIIRGKYDNLRWGRIIDNLGWGRTINDLRWGRIINYLRGGRIIDNPSHVFVTNPSYVSVTNPSPIPSPIPVDYSSILLFIILLLFLFLIYLQFRFLLLFNLTERGSEAITWYIPSWVFSFSSFLPMMFTFFVYWWISTIYWLNKWKEITHHKTILASNLP